MPGVIMTNNCSELRKILSEVFPTSNLLLCSFHILQQVWRWLFDKKHGILAIEWKLSSSSGRYCIQEELLHLMNL